MSTFRRMSTLLVSLSLGLAFVQPAAAHDDNALFEQQIQWWQWASSIPADQNPLVDETGENCAVGQRGEFWYLAGNFGESETTRHCTVPKGVKLLVPVIVTFCYPEIGYDDNDSCIAYVNDIIGSYRPSDLSLKLDGQKKKLRDVCELAIAPGDDVSGVPRDCKINVRANRRLFTFVIGQNSILASDPGLWRANAIRGVWGVIDTNRLGLGDHTLRIRAIGNGVDNFTELVTYKLTIARPTN
jgi:hypothetical protein